MVLFSPFFPPVLFPVSLISLVSVFFFFLGFLVFFFFFSPFLFFRGGVFGFFPRFSGFGF